METKEVAKRLVEYCRKGDWSGAHKELYAKDASSKEPYPTENFEQEVRGLDAIKAKGKKFNALTDTIHSIKVSEPLVVGSAIAFTLEMDITMKGQDRMSMPELCVYTLKDGKIISEEFFI
jgi:hypothetical protein